MVFDAYSSLMSSDGNDLQICFISQVPPCRQTLPQVLIVPFQHKERFFFGFAL